MTILDDLLNIGEAKPLGYLPLSTLEGEMQWGAANETVVETMTRTLAVRGLCVRVFAESECWVGSGALFAADLKALARLLETHCDIVQKAGWSIDPIAFIDQVAKVSVFEEKSPELYRVIGLAFADKRFTGIRQEKPMTKAEFRTKIAGLILDKIMEADLPSLRHSHACELTAVEAEGDLIDVLIEIRSVDPAFPSMAVVLKERPPTRAPDDLAIGVRMRVDGLDASQRAGGPKDDPERYTYVETTW